MLTIYEIENVIESARKEYDRGKTERGKFLIEVSKAETLLAILNELTRINNAEPK